MTQGDVELPISNLLIESVTRLQVTSEYHLILMSEMYHASICYHIWASRAVGRDFLEVYWIGDFAMPGFHTQPTSRLAEGIFHAILGHICEVPANRKIDDWMIRLARTLETLRWFVSFIEPSVTNESGDRVVRAILEIWVRNPVLVSGIREHIHIFGNVRFSWACETRLLVLGDGWGH